MKKILLIVAIASVFMSCGNGSESSASSDTLLKALLLHQHPIPQVRQRR